MRFVKIPAILSTAPDLSCVVIRMWHRENRETISIVKQGCQIFFLAYGRNPDKKWPKWLFFENVVAKITKCFNNDNFHVHRCLKLFQKAVYFLPKTCSFIKEASFYPTTAISAVNLKLPITTCLYLS